MLILTGVEDSRYMTWIQNITRYYFKDRIFAKADLRFALIFKDRILSFFFTFRILSSHLQTE